MRWPTLSAGAWKALLVIVALFMTGLWLTELWYAPRTLAPGAAGTLGIKYHELPLWGRSRYVIDEIADDSPLAAIGTKVGDVWIPDRSYDAVRRLEANEEIGLTLMQGAASSHFTVVARPQAAPVSSAPFVLAWVISVLALILGLIVGFRQPERVAFRALSMSMLILTAFKVLSPSHLILPAGTAFFIHHLLWGPAIGALAILFMIFLINFPDDQPRDTTLKRWLLRWIIPALMASAMWWALATFANACGYYVPLVHEIGAVNGLAFSIVGYAVMGNNWYHSQGDTRQRHLWILLAFAGMYVTGPLFGMALLTSGDPRVLTALGSLARLLTIFSLLIFGYAVLRHRVVSIGFAVNRAVVYGAASIGMLLTFGLLEWAAHHLLEFTGREKSMWLDAAIALGIFLLFHRLRHMGEQLVERLFFHAWHLKEAAMRRFVQEAPFITRPEALLAAFTTALDRFTDGAGHALYRRIATGDYERVSSTLEDSPAQADADEPLVVALRARQKPTLPADVRSALPGELALPSIHHGELDGFVVLGPKPNRETYRPDEQEVLGFAAHQIGLDFRALRMEQLERDVGSLASRNQELETRMAELRQALHLPPR
jgi:hypothetical protein